MSGLKVILEQEVKSLGRRGEVVEVAEGYGRNYLIPRGLAREATEGNLRALREKGREEERRAARERAEIQELAARMRGLRLEIPVKTGEGGRLFGSVTAKDVAEALGKLGFSVDKRKIELESPIKTLEERSVRIRLGASETVEITVALVEAPR